MQAKTGDERFVSGEVLMDLLKATVGRGASFSFRAKGSSMSPFIRDDDMITLSPLSPSSAKIGDVLAFTCPLTGKLIIHRMVGRKGDLYSIRADNASGPNEIVPETNILGRVTKVERKGKKVFFGLGPERYMIGMFSRSGFLQPLLRLARYVRSLGKSAG